MKKLLSLLLALSFVCGLAACGADKSAAPAESTKNQTTAAGGTSQSEAVNTGDKKILTVYFSSANTNTSDAVSSATPRAGDYASTEQLAVFIHEAVGGDMAKITPVKDYPTDYNGTADQAKQERDADERPEFLPLDVNPEDYDVIFVGYPIWWYTLPMVMYTFFDTYDFSGKTIVPFNTHAGSSDGGTYREIAEFEPSAVVLDGLPVAGSRTDAAQEDVQKWLAGLDLD
ncbi:MAG: flavodoxin [Clostridia bacterium]|nr:flavodoxin [Clostridia bacterium]